MSKQLKRGQCFVHRKPGESIEIAGTRVTVYVRRSGRAVLVIEPPAGTPVYRIDDGEMTELVPSGSKTLHESSS